MEKKIEEASAEIPYEFVEKFGLLGVQAGMPRSTARVLAYLLVCHPAEQSAANIQRALDLSLGSVSNALTTLLTIGIVDRMSKKGERTLFYCVQPSGIMRSVEQRMTSIKEIAAIASEGLEVAPHNPRLYNFHDIYETIITDFDATLAKLREKYSSSK